MSDCSKKMCPMQVGTTEKCARTKEQCPYYTPKEIQTMRDRLIELIEYVQTRADDTRCLGEVIADNLLANGVIVPPCKVGDTVYYLGGFDGTIIHAKKVKRVCVDKDGLVFTVIGKYMDLDIRQDEAYLTREEAEKKLKECEGE